MVYNAKQFNPGKEYFRGGDDNVLDANDKLRIQAYDLYENLYLNSSADLKLVLRGEDSVPLLMPGGMKIVEAVNRFLGLGFDFFVEPVGDEGTQQALDIYLKNFWKREALLQKFASNKRWGLVRGDAYFMLYADEGKEAGSRVSIMEVDPRQVFEIEDDNGVLTGIHLVEIVQDFRSENDENKKIVKRRTFRKADNGRITSELTFWEMNKWDDRDKDFASSNRVPGGERDEQEFELPETITQFPLYKWRNKPPQNSTWGISQLAGLETLLYGLNQSLTDEDATIVFQGLGMYVTNAKPPLDPATGEVTDWNIGPMQIIEIGQDQTFNRVTGVSDVSPYQNHMNFIDEKGIQESAGTPAVAIGKVDVSAVQSGIALKMELMPLLAANAEKELEMITVLDQMLHDLAVMWIPAYEPELGGNFEEISVVAIFDDPMPVDRDAKIQETLLLSTSNLILTSMAVAKLRELGWEYPRDLSDDQIVSALTEQQTALSYATDPFANQESSIM